LIRQKLAEIERLKKAQEILAKHLVEIETELGEPQPSVSRAEQAPSRNSRTTQHRELLMEEIKLAEQQLQYALKRSESGIDTEEQFLRATRDLYDSKRELARLDGDKAPQLLSIARDEMKLLEEHLERTLLKIKVGNRPVGSEIETRKELLRLRREVLNLQ
jgi:hypothetical protein